MSPKVFKFRFLQWLATYYYLMAGVIFILGLPRFARLSDRLMPELEWGQSILSLFAFKNLGLTVGFTLIALSLLSANFFRYQGLRIAVFLALFYFESLYNSMGSKTHLLQFWLWSAFPLALMPNLRYPLGSRDFWHLKKGIWASISIVLIFYSLSGAWKTYGLAKQYLAGEVHFLSENGLLYHVYSEIIRAGAQPIATNFLTKNPWINPILAFSVLTIQLGCLVGIWKVRLHRPIGILLLGFHIGTFVILDITYPSNFLLVIATLCLSPFSAKTAR